MCPESSILSALVDGELPSMLQKRVALHISGCISCRARIDGYRAVSLFLARDHVCDPDSVKTRVREKISSLAEHGTRPIPLYRRKIAVPLPAAAAFLAVLLGLGFLSIQLHLRTSPQTITNLPSGITEQLAVTIKVESMDQLVNLLASQNKFKEVTIELPRTPMFTSVGEPQFLREADYGKGWNQ